MKIVLSIFIFLLSISSAAQSNGYPDGSYYNDDYIHDEDIIQKQEQEDRKPLIRGPIESCEGVAVGEPSPYGNRCKPPQHIPKPKKKRKPAGGFVEVNTRGQMGDFKEVGGGGEDGLRDSRGSK